jgi:hypothetical protein
VIDGRDGKPLLDRAVKSSVGAQSSPLTVSVDGRGNDVFLYWNADCSLHEGEGGEFDFVKGTPHGANHEYSSKALTRVSKCSRS